MKNMEVIELEDKDLEWLKTIDTYIYANIGNYSLTTQRMVEELQISRSQLYRKLLILRGLTPNEYILDVRIAYAHEQLLTGGVYSVKEASAAVGIRKTRYFSEQFKRRFGQLPSDFLNFK